MPDGRGSAPCTRKSPAVHYKSTDLSVYYTSVDKVSNTPSSLVVVKVDSSVHCADPGENRETAPTPHFNTPFPLSFPQIEKNEL